MMDLFNEYHNQLISIFYELLKDSQEGALYTEMDIDKKLPIHAKLTHLEDALKTVFFQNTSSGMAARFSFHLPPLSPSLAEWQWLKTLAEDKTFSFLLSPRLHQKLKACLQNISPFTAILNAEDIRPQGDAADQEPLYTILTNFQQGLLQDRQITLTLKDSPHESMDCIPFRLEYDVAAKRFSLWITMTASTAFRRIPANKVLAVTPILQKAPDRTAAFAMFLQKHEREVLLNVKPKYNNVLRCFLLFASYQKESTYQEQTHEYSLKIHYYDFDELEIIQNIMSLGSAVTVLSPAQLRNQIIHRLKASWEAYQ